jgi:hypothetical protein
MVELLKRGRELHGVVSVKAEFEAEGTRVDELLRLVDIARTAGLPLTVKIGGCEAVRDLFEAKQIGVRYIVAPMVETAYALSKYIAAKNMAYAEEDRVDVDFLFNMETITAYENRNEIVELATGFGGVQGIVFGRVDFAGSMGVGRDGINARAVTDRLLETASLAKEHSLDMVVGGAISIDSLHIVKEVADVHLTRFETRKVVFCGKAAKSASIKDGLLNAVHFELLWMLNKRDYYSHLTQEDAKRIEMLMGRWEVLGNDPL